MLVVAYVTMFRLMAISKKYFKQNKHLLKSAATISNPTIQNNLMHFIGAFTITNSTEVCTLTTTIFKNIINKNSLIRRTATEIIIKLIHMEMVRINRVGFYVGCMCLTNYPGFIAIIRFLRETEVYSIMMQCITKYNKQNESINSDESSENDDDDENITTISEQNLLEEEILKDKNKLYRIINETNKKIGRKTRETIKMKIENIDCEIRENILRIIK